MFSVDGFLRWVFVARLTLAAGIFAAALLVWTQPQVEPEVTLLATLLLVLSLAVTAASIWHVRIAGHPPTSTFLFLQALYDVVLVTAVVHVTGRAQSDFVPLYVLVITEGALLLPLRGGLLVGSLATFFYFADVVWGPRLTEALGGTVAATRLEFSVFVRMALFLLIAGATAWLADRLRRTGTELGAVASELRQLRLDTSDILGTLDTGVMTVDSEGSLVYMNRAAERLLGMRSEDWTGRDGRGALGEIGRVAPGIPAVVNRTLETGRAVERYQTHSTAGPELRVLGVRSTPLERDDRPWVTVVMQDITEALRAEALRRRAERLEAVTELSASLAHEIKNPLASIRSAVEQLTQPASRLERTDRGVLGKLVVAESDRLSRLLSGFIEFSRVELQEQATVDLAKVAREAVEMVRQHPDSVDGPLVEVEADPVEVEGDPDLLHQVVFNLVLNAVQHAPAGSPVRLCLQPVPPGEVPAAVDLDEAVRLSVEDRGPGIRSEDVMRVFDPFYTTRPGGSGLGLALVHRAVEAHGGRVIVDTPERGGTTFTVYLPNRLRRVES